ncbi:MAG: class I SAM-dependent methyltransferase [Gemmatimonadaceae bacterium]
MRPPLPEARVERIIRERIAPRPTQWDYLHLAGLRRALADALRQLPVSRGPVLDLFCGAQPYRSLIPWGPVWGLDIDLHFRRANVLGALPLPFRDDTFTVALCTQALHLASDPPAAVAELRRVLIPGGSVIVTVPHIFRREIPAERKWTERDLRALFSGWRDVHVQGIGGPGRGLIFYPGSMAAAAGRRWPPARLALPVVGITLTAAGTVLDTVLRPLANRWPESLILVARRPGS